MQQNLYGAPDAQLADHASYAEVPMFSAQGRMGRWYYMAYGFSLPFLIVFGLFIALGIMAAVLIPVNKEVFAPISVLLGVAIYILYVVLHFMNASRRWHDLNQSGWMSLLFLVPFVNAFVGLYLLFAPGAPGPNAYGPPPKPASGGIIALALSVFMMVFVIGILAAIAIPQYQHYVEKAQAAQRMERESRGLPSPDDARESNPQDTASAPQ